MAYAQRTSVAADKTRAEIEKVLKKYGAHEFGYITRNARAVVMFTVGAYQVKFEVGLPTRESMKKTKSGSTRTQVQLTVAIDQEERRLWRSLLLCVKAKLEAVESGIATFEQEFFAYVVVPGTASTVGEKLIPELQLSAKTKDARPLLGYHWEGE